MDNVKYGLILTTIAGLSTTLGFFVIFIKGRRDNIVSFFLSFAGGVMITLSIFDLIPSSFSYLHQYYFLYRLLLVVFLLILGIFLSNFVKGCLSNYEHNNLKKIGFLSLISIILHNIPEGIITFMASQTNREIGLSLSLAISLHNIPEGISIAIPLYYATKNKAYVFFIVLVAGLSELLGGILTYFFFTGLISDLFMGMMFSLIASIMLNVSFFGLLKESWNYSRSKCLLGFICGFFGMLGIIIGI